MSAKGCNLLTTGPSTFVNLAACCLADGRRTVRQRKVSARVAVVTDADRRSAANARLEALETDHDAAPTFQDSDEEFVLSESDKGKDQRTVCVHFLVPVGYLRVTSLSCRRTPAWQEQREEERQADQDKENKRDAC